MTTRHPWYWAWRGWRASTWLFLLWSALLWPEIVSVAVSDEFLSEVGVAILLVVWLVGVGGIALTRHLVAKLRAARAAPPRGGRAAALVRTALPFAAALFLAYLVAVPLLAAWHGRPSEIETAVAEQWQGKSYTLRLFAVGGGEPVTTTATEGADEVSCETIDAEVGGAPVHVCEIVHCDSSRAAFLSCPETTSLACAALVDEDLVLVSRTWSAGPESLREEMARTTGGRC